MSADPALEPLTLRPSRRVALRWTLAVLVLLTAGAWFVVDSHGHPFAWLAVAVFVAVGSFFVGQLVAPGAFALHLDETGLEARLLWQHVDVAWDVVHVARVRRVIGDPILELHVREPSPTGDPWRTRAIGVLLPVGYDAPALHAFLAARLGVGGPPIEENP